MSDLQVERLVIGIDRSGLNPIADLRLLGEYRRILKRMRPAAFLGFTIKPNIYGCIAARSLGIPAIANISGLGTVFIKRGPLLAFVTRLYRFGLSRAAVVFFQNPDDRALFVARRMVRPEQARLLPGSGVDLDRFAPAPQPVGPPTFLLIARLLGDKGVREFVAAARSLRADLPDARFQLLGPIDEGNRTAIARAELDEWIAQGAVDYLGETDDVRPYVAAASAVVLPSYREGLPRSLLEAAAMARPLIATDVPGCREVVEDGINGILCQARDAESLAKAMKTLAKAPVAKRSAMGEAARRKVQDQFSETVVIAAYLDALDTLALHRS
jgi:glycosyltransferase involved in cell wall biosynthesis